MSHPKQTPKCEDFNQPTKTRRDLLARLENAFRSNVPRHFWAACYLCDIQILQKLAEAAESNQTMLVLASEFTNKIIEGWNNSRAPVSNRLQPSREGISVKYLSAKEKAMFRDNNCCILTGIGVLEVAHIYPHELLRQDSASLDQIRFWNSLKMFFFEEKLVAWKAAVQVNKQCEGENPTNLLCLSPLANALWNMGAFALKPVSISQDQRNLTVEFFWQAEYSDNTSELVGLRTLPPSTKGLDGSYSSWLAIKTGERIKSGDKFVLRTHDPKNCPLPSFALLELQWFCRRLLALAGPYREIVWDNRSEEEGDCDDWG